MSTRKEDFSKVSMKFSIVMAAVIVIWLLACFTWGAANAVDIRATRYVSSFREALARKRDAVPVRPTEQGEVRQILDLLANEKYKEAIKKLKKADAASPYLRTVLSDEEIASLGLENIELGAITETLRKNEEIFLQALQLYSTELGLHSMDEVREALRRYEAAKAEGDPLASLKLVYTLTGNGTDRAYPEDAKELARRAIEEARRMYAEYGKYVF